MSESSTKMVVETSTSDGVGRGGAVSKSNVAEWCSLNEQCGGVVMVERIVG